jgi:hypothetical protein
MEPNPTQGDALSVPTQFLDLDAAIEGAGIEEHAPIFESLIEELKISLDLNRN